VAAAGDRLAQRPVDRVGCRRRRNWP